MVNPKAEESAFIRQAVDSFQNATIGARRPANAFQDSFRARGAENA
jgi:hypothetical protein